MQHGDHGPALLVPSRHLIEQHRRGLHIDRSKWLVKQNNCGILQNEPREQRPLKLADRDLANTVAPAVPPVPPRSPPPPRVLAARPLGSGMRRTPATRLA